MRGAGARPGAIALPAVALALVVSAACATGCSTIAGDGPEGGGPLAYSGPAGWETRILQEPPPYGLAQFVEPRTQGIPDASRGFLLIGKARVWLGQDPLATACENQWASELRSAIPPVGRRPIQAARAGAAYTGWEAKRVLPDGTAMRLRTLCGVRGGLSTYLFLSAPDQSRIYESVWENLLRLNVDAE